MVHCPPKISREISKKASILVAKSMQEEPFLDQLLQEQSQWIANGHPSKPLLGVNTSKKSSKAWEVTILYTTCLLFYISIVLFV